MIEVVSCTLPSVAVIVSFCANVEASVVVNTPFALVMPEMVQKLLFGAAARQRHRRVRNEIAVSILHRHRQRGGGHAVRRHRSGARYQSRGRRRRGARIEGHRGGLVHAAFGCGNGIGRLSGGEESVVVNTPCALVVPEVARRHIAGAAAQRHGRVRNEIALGILTRHRQRGVTRHPPSPIPGLSGVGVVADGAPGLKVTEGIWTPLRPR